MAIFVVTGILFGLMAFTFAMAGPFKYLSIAAGVFVSGIMTIQEVETWLSSFDKEASLEPVDLTAEQSLGSVAGQIIAIGNVLALSLLFSFSLTQALVLCTMPFTPALLTGLGVAFTFGAFTEYYFYNHYLADFCKDFNDNLTLFLQVPNVKLGLFCIITNALVNTALTYSGIMLFNALLLSANVYMPPLTLITVIAGLCSLFAGSASCILGMDFWCRQNPVKRDTIPTETTFCHANNAHTLFSATAKHHQPERSDFKRTFGVCR